MKNPEAERLLAENKDLSARDMRDLLMEYEVDAGTATALTSNRLAAETGGRWDWLRN